MWVRRTGRLADWEFCLFIPGSGALDTHVGPDGFGDFGACRITWNDVIDLGLGTDTIAVADCIPDL